MNIGESLKEARLSRNLSLNQLERLTGISNQNLCRWENGVIPGVNFCIQLAQFYGITVDELIGLSDYQTTLPTQPAPKKSSKDLSSFDNEYAEIISDNNFIQIAKLYKAIPSELRALALGYIIGILQNNGVNTKSILGY